ncbi:hypothetical protein BGZ65_012366 [Modicella reniformis]|uniref:Uncharacterized protein n=1 Tax=Modicella reniformis TaxID=1440133 RepID=A0A9P6MJT9_9FUNG|nr:hypothetical protein BGZ65_012366 [Modicella reniformis]
MSREQSEETPNNPGPWSVPSPRPVSLSAISSSLFGAAESATGGRMRIKSESPLFMTEEDNEESRATKELLVSEDKEPIPPQVSLLPSPGPSSASTASTGAQSRTISNNISLPSPTTESPRMSNNRSTEGESTGRAKTISNRRKGNKTLSLLGPILPSTPQESVDKELEDREMIQELRPVFTSKQDREAIQLYSSEEGGDEENKSGPKSLNGREQDLDVPPPLAPRPTNRESLFETSSMQESLSTQVCPTIQSREDLIDRMVDIVCGQPESGAHRFRILTIQVATELLLELVLPKGISGAAGTGGKDGGGNGGNGGGYGNGAAQQAAEILLGKVRLQRLALAEAQFRERVQKGIRRLERMKRSASGAQGDMARHPLGILTGRVDRGLTDSKLGIDKQVVTFITEASMIYGPDSDPDKEPELDPDPDLIVLFGLDPEYTTTKHDKFGGDDDKTVMSQHDQPMPSSCSTRSTESGKRSRSRIRNRLAAMMQGISDTEDFNEKNADQTQPPQPPQQPQRRLTSLQRLEAMVIRYIKWLHLLIQCRQLVCRKACAPTMVTTASVLKDPEASVGGVAKILISEPSNTDLIAALGAPTPIRPCTRSPGELLDAGSVLGAAHNEPQKMHAVTAATDSAVDSTSTSTTPSSSSPSSASSSPTSFSSMASPVFSPATAVAATGIVSATLSQPASGTASGRIIGSRPLMSATAALEAAANGAAIGEEAGSSFSGVTHPFLNDILTNHLDPLSASVSEVIRKGSERIKKSVVDPLATNALFRSMPLSPTTASETSTLSDPTTHTTCTTTPVKKGTYRPSSYSAPASIASLSNSSISTIPSVATTTGIRTAEKDPPARVRSTTVVESSSSLGRISEDNNDFGVSGTHSKKREGEKVEGDCISILDPGHPALETDHQVAKILQTLGLTTSSNASLIL